MKFAFAILCHKNVEQINLLVDTLTSYFKEDDIYIHLDKNSDLSYNDIKSGENVYFVENRIASKWGHMSLVHAKIELFKMICSSESEVKYDYIWLISGQDFPIKQRHEMVDFIRSNYGRQFISGAKANKRYMERVLYYYPEYLFSGRVFTKTYVHMFVRYSRILGKKRELPDNMEIYKGSNWITITPEFAEYAVQMFENPLFTNIFQSSYIPEESFFQVIAHNSDYYKSDIYNSNLRMVDWTRYWNKPFNRPHIFTIKDYDRILASDKFFARKFDTSVDKEIMLKLREQIFGGEG